MSTWTHRIDRAGNTASRMTAHFESEGASGAFGAAGQGRGAGLAVGVYDEAGALKGPDGTAAYVEAAAVPGQHTRPARMTIRVKQDGKEVLYGAFYPVETAPGELNLNAALTAGLPLTVTPERLKTLDELIDKAQSGAGVLSGTSAQRRALPAPAGITEYRETDTHRALTYYPGTGWRDVYGNDPDAAAPPPDTGEI